MTLSPFRLRTKEPKDFYNKILNHRGLVWVCEMFICMDEKEIARKERESKQIKVSTPLLQYIVVIW